MEFQQLKYFKAVADEGKLVKAAQDLFISPPALSASIARLEKEVGMKLFDRTSKSIVLNKQGKIFLHYVNHIFQTLDNAKAEMERSVAEEDDRLVIAVTSTNSWIDLICAFTLEYPEINISHSSVSLTALSDGDFSHKFDFLLAAEGDLTPGSDLIVKPVFTDQLALLVNPDHPLAGKKDGVSLSEVLNQPFFAPTPNQSVSRILEILFQKIGKKPHNYTECSYLMRRSMVIANRGVTVSTMRGKSAESDPGILFLPITDPVFPLRQILCHHTKSEFRHSEKLFLDFADRFYAKK